MKSFAVCQDNFMRVEPMYIFGMLKELEWFNFRKLGEVMELLLAA